MSLRCYILFFFTVCLDTAEGQTNTHNIINELAIKADSINLQGRKYMMAGRRDSAKKVLEKALEVAKESGNSVIIGRCYIDMAAFYMMQIKYSVAKEYMDKARPFFEMSDNYEIKITGIMQMANLFNGLDKKDSAIYYYRLAEKYNSEKAPYKNYVVYMALGELYNQMDDAEEAEKYFLKSYNITSKKEGKPDHIYLLTVYLNFCLEKKHSGNAGALIAEYNELLEWRKRKNVKDPLNDVLAGLTGLRLESDTDFLKAVKEKSLQNGLLYEAMIANAYLIKGAERKKDYSEALRYANEGEELANKTGSLQRMYEAKRVRFNLLKKSGNYEAANTLAESLFDMKDSLLLIQKREQLYELEAKFETEKKRREIALLSSNNLLKEKEIALLLSDKKMASLMLQKEILQRNSLERENMLMDSIVKKEQAYSYAVSNEKQKQDALNAALGRENKLKAWQLIRERNAKWFLAAGAGLLLLSGGIILALYKKQKNKNSIIQRQSADLQVLMREIHHRVKNNLQVISSLLDLQSMTIADSQASEAVKEGKNRVQSMALIHQNLYSDGNIKGIKTKEYISNLLQSLCDSYNITNDKVKLHTQIDDLNLDVDTMIPLGLVLNELVSNSLKYAFRDGHPGELNILLKKEPQHLLLKVSDNGAGYPEGMNAKEGKSFGMKMIRAFAQKLKAKLDVYNNNGAVVEMQITKYKLA